MRRSATVRRPRAAAPVGGMILPPRWPWTQAIGLSLLAVLTLGFVLHALGLGLGGLAGRLPEPSRLMSEVTAANIAIFGHMMAGALITLAAPLQLIGAVRRRWPALHRWSGRVLVAAALLSALGGLAYIGLRGTIGGWDMSLSFAIYGALLAGSAVQVFRHARAARWVQHQDWALRFFFLAIGSWLYRVHYGLWELATGGVGTRANFSGAFDLVNIWAFYVPYLLVLEWVLWRRGRGLLR